MQGSKYEFTKLQSGSDSLHSKQPDRADSGAHLVRKQNSRGGSQTQLRLYWSRSLTCIFLPLFITGFYCGIWTWWLNRYDDNGPVLVGPAGGRWAYYIWFVVSAVGIGMSKYGLAGVEAGLLMDGSWAPRNAMQLVAHSDKTWSGPAGWLFIRTKPSPAWVVLFMVSLMPYIALPLSGFTLELTSGYSSAIWDSEIGVYGQTKATFLDQNLDEVFTRSHGRWSSPRPSTLSGRSAYYMPANDTTPLGRSWLSTYPNDWPDYAQMTVFIAPQSPGILKGKGWGLESNLSCSIIDSIDQFELLSQRNADKTAPRCPPINFKSSGDSPEYIGLPDLCDHDVYTLHQPDNETLLPLYITTNSYFPVGEMEIAVKYDKAGYDDSDPFSDPEPVIMEVVLWQNPIELVERQCPRLSGQLSNELSVIVDGMEKDFRLSDVSAILTGQTDQSSKRLSAIGVQCRSTFRTGTATIDGLSGTYASFTHEPADSLVSATPVPAPTAVPRIFRSEISGAINLLDMYKTQSLYSVIDALPVDWTSGSNMDLNPVAYIASNVSWLTNVYKSVDAYSRTAMYCDGDDPTTTSSWQQLQLIDSRQLQQSLIRAYKAYALEMTKPSAITFSSSTLHPVKPTSIISRGKIPPVAVLVLLAVWALGSCTLGLMFGLRPRWSETLDGFSMFRFGSDRPGFSINEAAYAQHYSDCQGLRRIPGLVGASKDTEHVTLVKRHEVYEGD